MTESSTARNNKALNSTYFENSERTIVNSINKTYKNSLVAIDRSNDAVNILKRTIGDIENKDVETLFNEIKQYTGKESIIEILYNLFDLANSNNTLGGIVSEEKDISGDAGKIFYSTNDEAFYYWDGTDTHKINNDEFEENPIDFDQEW